MQNAKDTFYVMLQNRLTTLNPARTIVVRCVVRPGTLVDENELATAYVPMNSFRLQWSGLQVDNSGSLPLVAMECSIQYATEGTQSSGGMDRGRLLAAMDAELAAALKSEPHTTAKVNFATAEAGTSATTMATNVFWADPVFGSTKTVDKRLERTTTVQVFAYQEAGEL
jgi:hypothetical protein